MPANYGISIAFDSIYPTYCFRYLFLFSYSKIELKLIVNSLPKKTGCQHKSLTTCRALRLLLELGYMLFNPSSLSLKLREVLLLFGDRLY